MSRKVAVEVVVVLRRTGKGRRRRGERWRERI
jgi:hypothetical protein